MKVSSLYYPPLKRQSIKLYLKKEGGFYATYNCDKNYKNVSKDCQNRCVYCDAHVDECGGERFSLDHFRPIDIFGNKFDGILKIHPFNLHLSCQKCNVLKTNDWKGCRDTHDGPTFLQRKGYIDRFKHEVTDYLRVDSNGRVQCENSDGPGKYMIGKLLLNRTNRVYIRKRREVKAKADLIQGLLLKKNHELLEKWNDKLLTEDEVKKEMAELLSLSERFHKLGVIKI